MIAHTTRVVIEDVTIDTDLIFRAYGAEPLPISDVMLSTEDGNAIVIDLDSLGVTIEMWNEGDGSGYENSLSGAGADDFETDDRQDAALEYLAEIMLAGKEYDADALAFDAGQIAAQKIIAAEEPGQ